jgi:hypothetical protein
MSASSNHRRSYGLLQSAKASLHSEFCIPTPLILQLSTDSSCRLSVHSSQPSGRPASRGPATAKGRELIDEGTYRDKSVPCRTVWQQHHGEAERCDKNSDRRAADARSRPSTGHAFMNVLWATDYAPRLHRTSSLLILCDEPDQEGPSANTLNDLPLKLDAAALQLGFDDVKDELDWHHR